MEPQSFHEVNKRPKKVVHQPIRLGKLSITSWVESNTLGAFLLAAKEMLRRETRTTKVYGRACCASTALKAGLAYAREAHAAVQQRA